MTTIRASIAVNGQLQESSQRVRFAAHKPQGMHVQSLMYVAWSDAVSDVRDTVAETLVL
jgi:hypothetical protein